MEGILNGWRFKNKTPKPDAKSKQDPRDKKVVKGQGAAHKHSPKEQNFSTTPKSFTNKANNSESTDNRSNEMRLSKNTPSKPSEESFDIPAEPVVPPSYGSSPTRTSDSSTVSPSAVIGPKITFKGELSGEEDLLIQGKVEGTVDLKGHHLTVGKQGVVKANLVAKSITIEGTIEGDLVGQERISIKASSNVKGNLIAERVTLEDGARFRGSIDMDSKQSSASSSFSSSSSSSSAKTSPTSPTPEKA